MTGEYQTGRPGRPQDFRAGDGSEYSTDTPRTDVPEQEGGKIDKNFTREEEKGGVKLKMAWHEGEGSADYSVWVGFGSEIGLSPDKKVAEAMFDILVRLAGDLSDNSISKSDVESRIVDCAYGLTAVVVAQKEVDTQGHKKTDKKLNRGADFGGIELRMKWFEDEFDNGDNVADYSVFIGDQLELMLSADEELAEVKFDLLLQLAGDLTKKVDTSDPGDTEDPEKFLERIREKHNLELKLRSYGASINSMLRVQTEIDTEQFKTKGAEFLSRLEGKNLDQILISINKRKQTLEKRMAQGKPAGDIEWEIRELHKREIELRQKEFDEFLDRLQEKNLDQVRASIARREKRKLEILSLGKSTRRIDRELYELRSKEYELKQEGKD